MSATSPQRQSTQYQYNTLYNVVVGGREGISGSDPNDDISSKRRRPSGPLGGRQRSSRHNRPSLSYPSPIVEDTKYDESQRSSIEGELAGTSRTSPATFESASLRGPNCLQRRWTRPTRSGKSAKSSAKSMSKVCCTTWRSGARH